MWLPNGNDEVVKTTLPVLSRLPLKMMVLPSSRLTFPVGFDAPLTPATEIVKLTGCPNTVGLPELVMLTEAAAGFTTWVRFAEEPPTRVELPLNTASSG